MRKVFIFDFDGVLCNSNELAYDMHNTLSAKFNLPQIHTKMEYLNVVDGNSLENYFDNDIKEEYYCLHRELMYKNSNKVNLFNDVNLLFSMDNSNVYIVSSNYERTINAILKKQININKKVFQIFGRETLGNKKDKIYHICRMLNIGKENIIYVGDTYSDILMCQDLGVDIVVSDFGYSDTRAIKSDNIIGRVNTIKELIEFINNLK